MSSLGQKARSAVIWNGGFNLFRDFLQFGVMLALVRLLKPESYGQFAMVTSVIGFLSIFSHTNFIAHILQVKDEGEARYQDHFTAGAVLQVGMFALTNLVAIVLRWFPTYSAIAPFVHVMSITFLLEWPCELRRKMLERQLDWRRLRLLQAVGLVASALLALAMAAAGAGTYALLLPGMLVTVPFIYDLFVSTKWRPSWVWAWDRYRPAWNFGLARIGSAIVGGGRQLLESGVLTAIVGFAALGVFGRAIGLAQLFCLKFSTQLMYAIYPVLTRNEGGAGRMAALLLRFVAWIALPTAVVLAQLAEPVVRVIYGQKWLDVAPLLPWTMTWGALSALSAVAYMLLLSTSRTRQCLYVDVVTLAGTALALAVALPNGTIAYVGALGGVQVLVLGMLSYWLLQCRALTPRAIFDAIAPPVIACVVSWQILYRVVPTTRDSTASIVIESLVWGIAYTSLYLLTLRVGFSRQMREVVVHLPLGKTLSRFLALGPN